jgi:hypothetical protein
MHSDEPPPKKYKIMADYGDAYAWDEKGRCVGISYNFPGHPRLIELEKLEEELEEWAGWFGGSEDNDPSFPWDAFHQRGLDLAKGLAGILKGSGIPVTYERPFEDPDGKDCKEIPIGDEDGSPS